ncbi:MAG: hypothetical protein CM15mP1_0550 [Methanobacteriota archaeon]|nr:MAG: hypothetical protein CM15mP1_0550 [Euryarchaeota archaeon]
MGGALAIGVLAVVIWSYEKSLPVPESSPPPTDEEIEHVVSLAISTLEWGKNEAVNFLGVCVLAALLPILVLVAIDFFTDNDSHPESFKRFG